MKEHEWTICFHFPLEDVFPSRLRGYQNTLVENVLVWTDIEAAKKFARERCVKYEWDLFPTAFETVL